jgi:Protein of unknown function (DUF5661)
MLLKWPAGMDVELEHGRQDPATHVTDEPITAGAIALSHLRDFEDCYRRLERMEAEADAHWSSHSARHGECQRHVGLRDRRSGSDGVGDPRGSHRPRRRYPI